MILAKDKTGKLTNVSHSGQKELCPVCNAIVTGKIYREKQNHFAHLPDENCSLSNGLISDWHLSWQSLFEVTEYRFPELGLRADVLFRNGLVLELQHSNISYEELRNRENGYKKMIWLFDATNFDSEKFYMDDFIYWHYPNKNWLCYTKPAFFQVNEYTIIQFTNMKFLYSENKGGFRKTILKSEGIFYTVNQFIDMCYQLDNLNKKSLEISENRNL